MADLKVITFESHGPADTGLAAWEELDPDGLVKGSPVQRGHYYYTDETGNLSAGVWDCTSYESTLAPYPVNEFMHVLEGSVTIVNERGEPQTFRAGDSFIIPKHMSCIWKQTEYMRKYFVIFDDPSGMTADNSAALSTLRLGAGDRLPSIPDQDPARFDGEIPEMGLLNAFTDVTGQFAAGVWESSPMTLKPSTIMRSELIHLLEGSMTITNADGESFTYAAGDTFLVPRGMGYRWHNSVYVKKVFCSFTPALQ